MTTGANSELDFAEGLFKDLVWDSVIKAALAALYADVPALAIWPIRPVLNYIVGMLSDRTFAALKLITDVQAIRLVNDAHRKAFDLASVTLQILAHDQGIDSPAFQRARENAKEELSRFVRFGH